MGRNIAERGPRLDVVGVMGEPTSLRWGGRRRGTLKVTSLIKVNTEDSGELRVVGRPADLHEMSKNRGESHLNHRLRTHPSP